MKKRTTTLLLVVGVATAASNIHAEITTGWLQTEAGNQQFLEPDNWVGGVINGVFSSDWSSSSSNTHSIRLTEDWTGTIKFYGNIYKEITFAGYNATNNKAEARTITLTDDLVIQPAVSQYTDSRLTFDANIGFDFGGKTRTIFGNSAIGTKFRVSGSISNGNLVLDGDGAVMTLTGAGAVDGDVLLRPNTTLAADYPVNATNVKRANDVELHRATLWVNARNASDTACFGALSVTGADAPGMSILQVVHNNKLAIVEADSLSIADGGALALMAGDPGVASDATKGSRILFTTTPTLRGSGEVGTTSAPVLPGLVVGPNSAVSNIAGQYGNNQLTLAAYDATTGLRKLADAETSQTVSDGVNLVVPSATTLTLDSDATVNSLQMRAAAYNSAVEKITGNVTLTVQSGMVLATAPKDGAAIDVALNFGANTGYLVAGGSVNYGVNITKPVSGSGGLVLTKGFVTSWDTLVASSTSARGFNVTSSSGSTYTGDTYVQCIVEAGSSDFLPHGNNRKGNTVVNGSLNFNAISINGLYGTGAVRGTTLTVGEDGSDSLFAGTGYLTSALNIAGGKFNLAGKIAQGAVNVAAGAAIGGDGQIQTTLAFAAGAKFSVEGTGDAASCLDVNGAVTGNGTVTVDANVTGGAWQTECCVLKSGVALPYGVFTAGEGIGSLELRNNDTELWATPATPAADVTALELDDATITISGGNVVFTILPAVSSKLSRGLYYGVGRNTVVESSAPYSLTQYIGQDPFSISAPLPGDGESCVYYRIIASDSSGVSGE